MRKLWFTAGAAILGLALCCASCSKKQPSTQSTQTPNPPAQSKAAAEPQPASSSSEPPAKPAMADPNVVATIGEYTITGDEFKKQAIQEMQPNPYSGNPIRPAPELKAVILRMLGEKAIVLDARQRGVHQKEEIQANLKRTREQQTIRKLINAVVAPRVVVKDQDVNELMAKDPNLPRERARAMIFNQRGNAAVAEYYTQLTKDRHLKKVPENFAKVSAVNTRLLTRHRSGPQYWILTEDVRNNIDPNEKALVLATFDGGTFTLKDLFEAILEMSPPSRPKDLDTPQGVERFLDRLVSRPVMAAEAAAKGYDKDPEVMKALRRLEDQMTLDTVRIEKSATVKEPNEQEVAAAYEKVKDTYAKNDSLKVDMIWCEDRQAAAKAKADLDGGKDFKSVQTQYAVDSPARQTGRPAGQPLGPADDYMGQEGLFWQDLWKAEPNQVVGPVLGFRGGALAWRLVKVMEKREGKTAPAQNAMGMLKSDLQEQRQKALMDKLASEMLQKFPYQINADRLSAFDPRNVP
jgi:hypothetical protein